MRSTEEIVGMSKGLRRELSVYYLPASVWARDELVRRGIRAIGDVQDKPEVLDFMVDAERESVQSWMALIGLALPATDPVIRVPKATLESILKRLESIKAELCEALR